MTLLLAGELRSDRNSCFWLLKAWVTPALTLRYLNVVDALKEWSDRGNGLETLTRRLREEGERREEERGRLEKLVQAAEGEAGARGEELARMMVEFETRAACAEADMDEKVRRLLVGVALSTCSVGWQEKQGGRLCVAVYLRALGLVGLLCSARVPVFNGWSDNPRDYVVCSGVCNGWMRWLSTMAAARLDASE